MAVMSRFVPRDRAATEHYARVARIVFDKPDGSFLIAETPDGGTVMGPADATTFESGVTYKFLGRWEDDPARGYRFRFSTFSVHALHSRAAVVKYLCDLCEGIGPKAAEKLWTAYGGLAVEQLRERPHETAETTGLNLDLCQDAAEALTRDMRFQDTKIQLHGLFQGRGFQGKLIGECLDRWGPKAADVIRRNPFRLLDMTSAGFKRCDKLYLDCGLNPAAMKRQAICSANLVRTARDGHTWFDAHEIASRLKDLIPGADPVRAFKLGLRAKLLDKHRDEAGKLWITTAVRAYCERAIVDHVRRLSAAGVSMWPVGRIAVSQADGDKLPSAHQVERLTLATAGRVGLFVGGPGTGKTYTLAYVLKEVIRDHGAEAVAVCAPTGKAALRAGQSLRAAGVDVSASTIHSLLIACGALSLDGADGDDMDGFGDLTGKLDCKYLVVDECFVRGTLVDTPDGPKRIETLRPGDAVFSAAGADRVTGTSRKEADRVVRVTCGEATFFCSENHPFLTCRGWVGAGELGPGDSLVPATTAMRLVRQDDHVASELRGVEAVLRLLLLRELADVEPDPRGEAQHSRCDREARQGQVQIPQVGDSRSEQADGADSRLKPDGGPVGREEDFHAAARDEVEAAGSGRQRPSVAPAATAPQGRSRPGMGDGIRGEDEQGRRVPEPLQARPGQPEPDDLHRGGWAVAQRDGSQGSRRQETVAAGVVRVDRVEVLESGHPDLDQYRDASGKLYLHDVAVERHPSFSVSGCLVHNCSMVDTNLMAVLLAAVPTGCHVLFVGDPYQLPPVGHGSPLRDLIAAGLPCGELTQVRRNAGQIVHACLRIKNQEDFETTDRIDLDAEPPRNLRLIHAKDEKAQGDMLALILGGMKGFHPVWGCQVIVARNKGGEVTRRPLNERLQAVLNPDGYAVDGSPFRLGDKVICLKNSKQQVVDFDPANDETDERIVRDAANYFTRYSHDRDTGHREPVQVKVMNGEIGRVVAVGGKQMVVRFSERDELIRVPMGKADKAEDGGDDQDDNGRGCNFDLAYAVTCHKLQGSEAPCVIVVADANGGGVCTREWWYTAVSRAAKVCLIVGSRSLVDKQRVRVSTTRRKTFLVEQLTAKPVEDQA